MPAQPALQPIEAKVYGDIMVKLNEPTTTVTTGEGENATTTTTTTYGNCVVKGTIFGCNNLNGSPQSNVTVHVYHTEGWTDGNVSHSKSANKDDSTYDLTAVYGGGNLAAYYPDDEAVWETAKANVIIDGCGETSIKSVYGGGNAASAPATEVTVYGTYEIGEVFGGGNGADDYLLDGKWYDNPGANVGYRSYAYHVKEGDTGYSVSTHGSGTVANPYKAFEYTSADGEGKDASTKEKREANYSYGTGKTQVNIYGGTVHAIYGGSNSKGNVRVASVALLDGEAIAEDDAAYCEFDVDEAYGGGKNADMDGTATLIMTCIQGMKEVYGGAKDADVNSDVTLNITNGTFDQVFGGNNVGGRISGSITVNVEETGCKPVIIGELYGGGNNACYSVYGYYDSGETDDAGKPIWKPFKAGDVAVTVNGVTYTPQTEANKYGHPVVNVKSFTGIGNIFGGGYGEDAVMVADPTLNINVMKGRFSSSNTTARFPNTKYQYVEATKCYKRLIDGRDVLIPAKDLNSSTTVIDAIGAIYNVYGGGNAANVIGTPHVNIGSMVGEPVYLMTMPIEDVEGKTSSQEGWIPTYEMATVEGIDIRGDVFGGGNAADVTGDTKVVIGRNKDIKTYSFTSFSAENGGDTWSSGLAQTTGKIVTLEDNSKLAEVEILANGKYKEFVGQKFYVAPNATADGSTRVELKKDVNGTMTASGLWVAIRPFAKKTYNFTSYGAATGGTQYSTGTATPTGNFKVFSDNKDYMQIEVLTNPGETSWEGRTFYVPADAKTDGTDRTKLLKTDGSEVGVWVTISIPEATNSSSSGN